MRILISNDDGIDSDGLLILSETLSLKGHEVWISAPDTERSAFSHALTLREPVKFHKRDTRTYSCSGTPADCIFYALKGAVPVKPDVVISGINKGYNVGTDIIYSGTFGAAREAALHKVPAIAISAEGFEPPFPFAEAAAFLAEHLAAFLELWTPDVVININVPFSPSGSWEAAYPEQRDYGDTIEPFQVKKHEIYYLLSGGNTTTSAFTPNDRSDMEVLSRGHISVSPVQVHPSVDRDIYARFAGLYETATGGIEE